MLKVQAQVEQQVILYPEHKMDLIGIGSGKEIYFILRGAHLLKVQEIICGMIVEVLHLLVY